ncbi:molybdopterin-guanine dinucleotide biosynthesis protein B [Oceanobacillus limi]|uniref:Molybdopterin-guanine dinucleotide biosynthesis protein B n=1 Tax=Oceanobacillus limi TaxID=930131 RepID=A0A1I0GAT4_9BACI|nr:molybdopterin-guanine dinucleotide biosynthesis protein B [Oceanobacillus limi]SET67224.1 molybdopterin-guanine dinucleotide biosynthesis protein B [Oceanobacillus limi]
MNILQIIGYKNSGKTTLSTAIIEFLIGKSIRVGALKHHGHGGRPVGIENTDSEKQKKAGALLAGVEGEGIFQLSKQGAWDVDQMIDLYRFFEMDFVVVEGFKTAIYPKVVVINEEKDLMLIDQLTNIAAVVASFPIPKKYAFPVFHDVDELIVWLDQELFENGGENRFNIN